MKRAVTIVDCETNTFFLEPNISSLLSREISDEPRMFLDIQPAWIGKVF